MISILELYPQHLAVNGDMGNNIVLLKRLELAGVAAQRLQYNPGEMLPDRVDIVTIGSGPESALRVIAEDIARIAPTLREWALGGMPMLAITAGFHLFGRSITLSTGDVIGGVGIFDLEVTPRASRALSNSFIVDTAFGRLIGVENHGVVVSLSTDPVQSPLGRVESGVGNAGTGYDGATAHNVIGTHIHGPVLAMNPHLADHLIRLAADRAGGVYTLNEQHGRIDAIAASTRLHLAKLVGTGIAARQGAGTAKSP